MPKDGGYLLSHVGFSHSQTPIVTFQQNEVFTELSPLARTLTLRFNMAQRFCIGWGSLATGERFVCPNHHTIEDTYEQCAACQQRTGFNPSFYHASRVSDQQEARNLQPHILYLAYFGEGVIKVGMSFANRGNSRLLEQGARSALILDTFPTAHVARGYEAKIAKLPGIAETIQLRKKIELLSTKTPEEMVVKELLAAKSRIEQELGVSFAQNNVLFLDDFYFSAGRPSLHNTDDCSKLHMISGVATGMLGSLLFCKQQDRLAFLPLKKYIGFPVQLSYGLTPLELPARQTSLF